MIVDRRPLGLEASRRLLEVGGRDGEMGGKRDERSRSLFRVKVERPEGS
jgi:hypothetical protein